MASLAKLDFEVRSEDLDFLIQEVKDYAFSTGFVMGSSSSGVVGTAPLCLFPSPFPKGWFTKAKMVQSSLNLLLYRISRDIAFLRHCLSKAALTDHFIQQLFKIMDTVLETGYKQTMVLGIFRMDYMLDTEGDTVTGMKQIEMNTISTSFGAFASNIHPIQRHVLKHLNAQHIAYPESHSLHEISSGLVSAWKAYGSPSAAIVFVIKPWETNFADQRLLEYTVCAMESKIKVLRHTFQELHTLADLKDYKLFVEGQEVAVVYYRTAYMPEQFENNDAWAVRLLLEKSTAVQCPNVPLQLAGMKKVQQELTREGVLEKFLPDVSSDIIQVIKTLFAGQFSLDLTDEGDKAAEMALSNPKRYVLKPQREGGGNNIFGNDIVKALKDFRGEDREAYVLMELITPPVQRNYIVRKDQSKVIELDIVGELGIYGVILGDGENVLVNGEAGHLLRCKEHGVNEGGVAVGYGALNLPYFV